MPRAQAVRHRLDDVLESIAAIQSYIVGLDETGFHANGLVRDGVERRLLVIPEACRHIPDGLANSQPQIPWRRIRDIGNWLRHAYDVVDHALIWTTVTTELEPLKQAIKKLIDITEEPAG